MKKQTDKKVKASVLTAGMLTAAISGCMNANLTSSNEPLTSGTEQIVSQETTQKTELETNVTSVTTTETQVVEISFNAENENSFSAWLNYNYGMTYWEFVSTFSVNDVLPYAVEYINEKKLSNIPVTIDDISLDTLNNMVHYIKGNTTCSTHGLKVDNSIDQHIENINFRFFDYGTLSMGTLEFNVLYKVLIENNIPFGEQIPRDVILRYADFYDGTYTSVNDKLVEFAFNKPNEVSNDYIACICIDWNYHIALYSIQIDNWSLKVSDNEIFTEALNSSIDQHFENNAPHVGEYVSIDWYNNTFEDEIDLNSITES